MTTPYTIIGFNSNNSNISLSFNGITRNFPLPIVNGVYPIGQELTSLLDTYVEGATNPEPVVIASNLSDIQSLVVQVTPPAAQLQYNRTKYITSVRDNLLRSTDYTQLPDIGLSPTEVSNWVLYRQGLRNIPQQPGFPNIVSWPIPPTPLVGFSGNILTNVDGSPVNTIIGVA